MALRRASLNEFLIKTLSGNQNTPPPPKKTPLSRGGRTGPTGTGGLGEPGPARGRFTGGSPGSGAGQPGGGIATAGGGRTRSPGILISGPAAGFGAPAVQTQPPAPPRGREGPGGTDRFPVKPWLDGTGGGRPGQRIPAPPSPAGGNIR